MRCEGKNPCEQRDPDAVIQSAHLSHEDWLELKHASNREQHSWVIRNEGAAGKPDMLVLLKVFEKTLSDLCTSQLRRDRNLILTSMLLSLRICIDRL